MRRPATPDLSFRRLDANAARTSSAANRTPALSKGTRVPLPVSAADSAQSSRNGSWLAGFSLSEMHEKDVSLPASWAFVIQLQASPGAPEVGHRGRVEHLASGRAMRFADEAELWAFVNGVLATLPKGPSEE